MATKSKVKYDKVECPICHKMLDPRGLGTHNRHVHSAPKRTLGEAYVDPAVAEAIDRANADGDTSWDVVMIPISREVILKLVTEWLQMGAKSKPKA